MLPLWDRYLARSSVEASAREAKDCRRDPRVQLVDARLLQLAAKAIHRTTEQTHKAL